MLPIFNISLIGRVDARRRARSERAFKQQLVMVVHFDDRAHGLTSTRR